MFYIGWGLSKSLAKFWGRVPSIEKNTVLINNDNNISVADEILKLKKLENEGILTVDEFNFKKTQLINDTNRK